MGEHYLQNFVQSVFDALVEEKVPIKGGTLVVSGDGRYYNDKAVQIILDVANADERVHNDPEPWVRLTNLGDSSVDLGVRLWCDAGNYWELKFHMLKSVKEAFDAGGISIPYPHSVEIQKAG